MLVYISNAQAFLKTKRFFSAAKIFMRELYEYTNKAYNCHTLTHMYIYVALQTCSGSRRKQCTPLATFIASRANLFISFNVLLLQFCYYFSYISLMALLFLAFYRWQTQSACLYCYFGCDRLQRTGEKLLFKFVCRLLGVIRAAHKYKRHCAPFHKHIYSHLMFQWRIYEHLYILQ